jgi:hypothetical protein
MSLENQRFCVSFLKTSFAVWSRQFGAATVDTEGQENAMRGVRVEHRRKR